MIGREQVKKWFQNQDTVPLPDEKEVFKSGTSFVNYIHLQVSLLKLTLCFFFKFGSRANCSKNIPTNWDTQKTKNVALEMFLE